MSTIPFEYDRDIFPDVVYPCRSGTDFAVELRRYLPSFALDISNNEGAGWTAADLHSYLVDGITVGGHTVRDEDLVRNIKEVWDVTLYNYDDTSDDVLCKHFISTVHSLLTKNLLAPESRGEFRKGNVSITGAEDWECPAPETLNDVFFSGVSELRKLGNILEKAIVTQLWLSYRQFYSDGNKRVARMICNKILATEKAGLFVVPNKGHAEFTRLLCDFYNTANANAIIKFILEHCLVTFNSEGYTERTPKYGSDISRMSLK